MDDRLVGYHGGGRVTEMFMVEQEARDTRDHPALSWVARAGFAMYGVVYVVIAVLAVQLAVGDGEGRISGQGALHELAEQSWGEVALVIAAISLAGLFVWESCQVIGGHTDRDGWKRIGARAGSAGRAIVFATLSVLAAQTVIGSSSGGGTDTYTTKLMDLPFGPALVVAVGLVIIGLGINSVHKGLSDRWRRELEWQANTGDTGTILAVLARLGHTARGAAFGLIGGFFVWAGLTHDPKKSAGLDHALRELRDAPYGPWLLGAIGVSLSGYGLFNIAKAWALRDH